MNYSDNEREIIRKQNYVTSAKILLLGISIFLVLCVGFGIIKLF